MILPFAYNPQPFADLSDFHSNLPALVFIVFDTVETFSAKFQKTRLPLLAFRSVAPLQWTPSGFRFTHPLFRCGPRLIVFIVFDTDFVIVGVVERGISSITKYLGVFLLLNMYIFDLREQNKQTICCTPHSKDYKSSVPSRRTRLRSILGFHCDLIFGLHCVSSLHCDLVSPLRSRLQSLGLGRGQMYGFLK